ncbi:MAG: 16S rRNA (uracil(1498)-N(3))-methyltransferase [Bacteroidia bacterium]|nr:16S rRNA (uracil(1498)-N(3))-methyltransferase [Bacteroidia bacterium]
MILFYSSQINVSRAVLEEEEFRHCCVVLRHKEGDIIKVTDGNGKLATARITICHKKHADLEVLSLDQAPQKAKRISIGIAPPKNRNRWEWFLEKSVEIGVDNIIPLICQNSERKKINLERNMKIMRSAALQSLRTHHPEIHEPVSLKSFIKTVDKTESDLILAHYHPENTELTSFPMSNDHQIILIGPEGDFSPAELKFLQNEGFISLNISDNRLRTETAGIVALCSII